MYGIWTLHLQRERRINGRPWKIRTFGSYVGFLCPLNPLTPPLEIRKESTLPLPIGLVSNVSEKQTICVSGQNFMKLDRNGQNLWHAAVD